MSHGVFYSGHRLRRQNVSWWMQLTHTVPGTVVLVSRLLPFSPEVLVLLWLWFVNWIDSRLGVRTGGQ